MLRRGYKYYPLTRLWQCNAYEIDFKGLVYYVHDSLLHKISWRQFFNEDWHIISNSKIIKIGALYIAVYGGEFASYDVLESLLYQTLFPNKKLSDAKFSALELKGNK